MYFAHHATVADGTGKLVDRAGLDVLNSRSQELDLEAGFVNHASTNFERIRACKHDSA
jgi:hypothetical protein